MQAVINGVRTHWRDEGSGDPVVFIHAFPFHGGMWDRQLASLPAGWRGIAPDLRGFGRTAASPNGPYTMDLFADDLAALLDHLKLEHAVLCGLSMGGYTALAFYRRHPQRVRALALCATRAGADSEDGKQNRRVLAARVRIEGVKAVVDSMLPKLVSEHSRNADPDIVGVAQQMITSNAPESIARALEGTALRPNSEPMLRTIEVPTIILHGEEDAIIPPGEAQIMARGIRGSRIRQLPQAGHLANLEKPAEFNRALGDFLENLPPFFGVLKLA